MTTTPRQVLNAEEYLRLSDLILAARTTQRDAYTAWQPTPQERRRLLDRDFEAMDALNGYVASLGTPEALDAYMQRSEERR